MIASLHHAGAMHNEISDKERTCFFAGIGIPGSFLTMSVLREENAEFFYAIPN
jgi:hypothetical protein